MKFPNIFFVVVLLLCMQLAYENLVAAQVDVLYLERPPYYYTISNESAGFLNETTKQLFTDAGIEFKLYPMPPKRIIKAIKNDSQLSCSPGWFKNKERLSFAKFTLPFYQVGFNIIMNPIE